MPALFLPRTGWKIPFRTHDCFFLSVVHPVVACSSMLDAQHGDGRGGTRWSRAGSDTAQLPRNCGLNEWNGTDPFGGVDILGGWCAGAGVWAWCGAGSSWCSVRGWASAACVIAPVPWESGCSGLLSSCFPPFLLCNKATAKGLDLTMRLDSKLPFETPVNTFPTFIWNSEVNRPWRRRSRDGRPGVVLTSVSRSVHVAPESLFLLMRTRPSAPLLSRSSLTSCELHFQYLLGAGFASATQSSHGGKQTPFRLQGGSAGTFCIVPVLSSPICVCSPSFGKLLCCG